MIVLSAATGLEVGCAFVNVHLSQLFQLITWVSVLYLKLWHIQLSQYQRNNMQSVVITFISKFIQCRCLSTSVQCYQLGQNVRNESHSCLGKIFP